MVAKISAPTVDTFVDDFDFEEFSGDFESGLKIPHAQIQTPKNLSVSDIEKLKIPYGVFLVKEQAEEVGFTPTVDWVETEIEFEGKSKPEIQKGYITKSVRFVIIERSELEVEKGEYLDVKETKVGNWQYEGLAYQNRVETEIGKKAKSTSEKLYRNCVRCLVYFLDNDNNPLHESPLQLKWRGGFKGTTSVEVKKLYEKVGKVYRQRALAEKKRVPGTEMSDEMKSLVVIDVKLGVHKSGSLNPFTCPLVISHPVIHRENIGTEVIEDRTYDNVPREIKILGVPLSKVLLSKTSKAGQMILEAKETYKDFGKPRSNRNAPKPFKSKGYFDPDTLSFNGDDGSISCSLVTDDGTFTAKLNETYAEAVTEELNYYIVIGTISNGIVTVKSLAADKETVVTTATQVPQEAEISMEDYLEEF